MTNEVYYTTISLRLRSSVTSADTMIATVGMTPSSAWNRGESRLLPHGKSLNMIKKDSFATFRIFEKDERWLPESITDCLNRLGPFQPFFSQLRKEGGSAELFIGWFLLRSGGDTLPVELLLEVGKLGLDLSFDIYPADASEDP